MHNWKPILYQQQQQQSDNILYQQQQQQSDILYQQQQAHSKFCCMEVHSEFYSLHLQFKQMTHRVYYLAVPLDP